ncbi:hypothetical protein [Jejuia spongiicola]|uniref:Uncharacterized protein n=1 Tax=Jejuia spongiicola TaxID=2942207 RepID=A0ABT0QFT9_9FLAO|nr:hypothetical protein [Jejuia spongiicola]MCL6295837.1 hypothetical protein [Jejuia spongiicola]
MSSENNWKNKLWNFVNTKFGIWLLSSAIVGLITFGYTKLSESISNSNSQKKQIVKLDQEIEGRFYQLISKQERRRDSINVNFDIEIIPEQETMKEIWFEFKASPKGYYQGLYVVYPEFSERNIASLIIELSSLVDDKSESEQIKKVAHRILSNELLPLKIESSNELSSFLNQVSTELRIERWRKYWPEK